LDAPVQEKLQNPFSTIGCPKTCSWLVTKSYIPHLKDAPANERGYEKINLRGMKAMDLFTHLFGQSSTHQLDASQASSRLGLSPRPFLLDVRQPEEYRQGHINSAELIPLGELSQKMKRIPKDCEVICVCHSGNRSSVAASQLAAAGYKVSNLRGGMIGWERAGLPVKKGMAK
jgi:rhodanese-related sulfurtransferase